MSQLNLLSLSFRSKFLIFRVLQKNHQQFCQCNEFYRGKPPLEPCKKVQCRHDADCTSYMKCDIGKGTCFEPCKEIDTCGKNATCKVECNNGTHCDKDENHEIICTCPYHLTGNAGRRGLCAPYPCEPYGRCACPKYLHCKETYCSGTRYHFMVVKYCNNMSLYFSVFMFANVVHLFQMPGMWFVTTNAKFIWSARHVGKISRRL